MTWPGCVMFEAMACQTHNIGLYAGKQVLPILDDVPVPLSSKFAYRPERLPHMLCLVENDSIWGSLSCSV